MIEYRTGPAGVASGDLAGFFVGWPTPPPDRLAVLRGAAHVVLAHEGPDLVGFATALSDGVLMASVSLVEVLPAHQGRGIGAGLVTRLLDEIGPLYGIDVCCDADTVGFYQRLGFQSVAGLVLRRRAR
ncbi:GNAT family N-acetyltransferase [Actinokineospora sp. NBRC 105648]|uniref:GNAT family N-acetyltransferase n=1 Tax=Actinokineospora sp. NBRC 105648 TaxID=3032206 RepID=UPI0024A54FBE|nr:GNAT family N-acetyltransferase [Actinokineospora sp. NBRC 105648]GLZ39163.1 N-acetyltransferase [Actinokineospora sp. NBRC 105648]